MLHPLKGTLAGSSDTLNWSETTLIRNWDGIAVGGSPQRVTGLELPSWSLSGSIPSGLGDLSNLTTLNLSGNGIIGSIPFGLGDLSSLVTLNLSTNQLSGAIPSELGDLSSLWTLDLSTNQLHGPIPSELGGLSSLITLNLSNNSLGGSIPSKLGNLSSLITLNLSGNHLSGSIPSKLGNLSNLTGLDLSGNELDWEIPEELNQLDKLREVDLNGNLGLIGPAHLDFTELSKAHLGYMETETWAVADFSYATTTWSVSGMDSGKFAITNDGVLTFKTAPDYEVSSDSDGDNRYYVEVTASAGGSQKTAEIYVYVMDRDFALSVSPGSIVEEGPLTQFIVTATLDGGTNQATSTTVTLSLAGSAGADDYATTTLSSITIPANSASATTTLTLDPTNDDIVEGDEVVKVVGASGDKYVSPAWITIDDKGDVGTLSLSGSGTAVLEGNDASFTVTLSDAIGPEVTVGWSVTPDSGDFSTPSGSVTFAAGSTANATTTLTLTATDDLLSEVLESFTVRLGAVTGDISDRVSVDLLASSTVATISESDPITVMLKGDSSVAEGESATSTVSLFPEGVTPTEDLTVDYATGDDDDTAGSGDYESATGTLTFTFSDAAAKTVTVQTTADSIAEGDETFSFGLSNVAGGGGPTPSLRDPSSITTTIDDDDAEPTSITLSVSPTEVSEGDGMATTTLTATLEGGTTRNATTTVALSLSGTATSTGLGADYTAVVPSEMTIPAEAATGTATLIITPTNDEIVEGEETIRVEGTVSNFTVSLAEITINDDDSGTLSLSGSGTDVSEGNDASFTVTLSDAIGPEVTVGWSVTPDSGDFSTPSGSVTFAAGSTANATTTLTLTATDDLLSEVLESFRVMLGAVTGDISDRVSVDLSASSTVATISESDPITVTLSGNSSVDEGESVTYTVSLDGVTPTADLTVGYATNPAVSGDYEGVSETLTFTFSDAAAKTVTVQTTEDSIAEGEETFSFELSNVAGGGGPTPSLRDPSSITTTIDDDDAEPTSITLSVSPTEVSEGDGMATTTLTATLEGGTTRNATTTVALSLSGTATSTGLGADYTAVVPSEMTIPAEAATGTATLIITPTNDEIVEGEETIRVEGTVSNFTVSPAEITIDDGDVGTLSLSGSGTAVSEGNDASYTVTLSHAIGHEVTVGWSVTSGSATAADYGTSSDSVTFLAGSPASSTRPFTIGVEDDLLSEVAESFSVMLGAVTGDISDRVSVDLSASSTVATISESDQITVTLSGNSSVDEGESVTYTVSLDGVTPTADLTVGYATNPAVSGDYEGVSETLTFTFSDAAAKTVTVQTTEDSIAEGEETFSFELSNVAGGGGPTPSLGDPWSITTTIVDDDRRHTQRPPTFNEGATTTRAALENSEVGTEVGEPVRATDRDGDRLEYWLRGTDRASFHLDPRTGQLTTALLLDYETQSEYSVQVRVRDGEGGSDGIDVSITIVDLDEAPSQPGAPEVRSTGPTGLAVSWTAPDNQGPEITDYDVRYREAGGEFQDAEFVGADTSITLNNLKPGTSYEVQVRAVNAEGASPWSESGRDETEHVPPSPTPTPTPTPEPTATATPTPEPTATRTPTRKPTATRTPTPEPTATPTPTPEPTATATPTPEPTATATPTPEPTATATPTPESTATATPTPEPTATPTPTPEPTATATPTPEPTATAPPTPEPTATATLTPEPTATAPPTPEPTATAPPTPEPTATAPPTPESTATAPPTPEPTTTLMAPPLSAPAPTSTLSPPPTSAPIATATPAVTPERRESDSEGGLPWWVILLLSLGGVGVVLFAWARRRRRQG